MERITLTPYTAQAFIQSLNTGKMQSTETDEITILEKIVGDMRGTYYIVEYKGLKCTAIFNPFTCRYYADDVYGVIQ